MYRETDKQRIFVNTQLKNPIYPIKIERTGTDTQIFVYGYCIIWAGHRICNCHLITEALANTFTIPVIVFNKHLACFNDHCLKIMSRGRWKGRFLKLGTVNGAF